MKGLCLVIFLLPGLLPAQSARSLVADGNQAYQAGEYDQAIDSYRQAQVASPNSAIGKFNEAAALYRNEDYAAAAAGFRSAAQNADSADLEAKSLFNLGNALLKHAESQDHDAQSALETTRQGAAALRQAVRKNPQYAAAAENLQIARTRLRDLLSRQDEPQSQGSSSGDLQEQVQEQLQQQRELGDETQQSQSGPDNEQQRQQQQQELAERQQELQQRSEDLADQAEQSRDHQSAQEDLEQAAEHQRQAAEQLANQRPEEASESQQQAEQRLEQALQKLQAQTPSGEQRQESADQQPEAPADPSPVADTGERQGQTLQALEWTPEDILDQERAARQRRQVLSRQQQPPVEKDW